jgi:hypothetical protein
MAAELTKTDLEEGADSQDLVEVLADRMELEGKDRKSFIIECMKDCGYEVEPSFVKADKKDNGNGNGGSRFGRRGNGNGNGGRRPGDDWE